MDRIEEIKARIAGYDDIDNDSLITAKGVAGLVVDAKYMLREIDRLKMMLDAAAVGQETMRKQWAADVERLTEIRKVMDEDIINTRLNLENMTGEVERLTSELSSAVADLNICGNCDTCKHDTTLACNIDAETGICNYEWRGVQK